MLSVTLPIELFLIGSFSKTRFSRSLETFICQKNVKPKFFCDYVTTDSAAWRLLNKYFKQILLTTLLDTEKK